MRETRTRDAIVMIVVSVMLVVIGSALVVHLQVSPPEILKYQGDARWYIAMADGHAQSVPVPFKYRFLVPALARLLPMDAGSSLAAITYICLFVSYFIALMICRQIGIGLFPSVIGLLAMYTARASQFNYFDPYLTDAFGLMASFIMLHAYLRNSVGQFTVAAVVGTLGRESVLFLSPLWLLSKRRWQTAMVICASVVALIVPRIVLRTPGDPNSLAYIFMAARKVNLPGHVGHYLATSHCAWHFLWFLAPAGIILIPAERRRPIVWTTVLLGVGAFLSSIIARDATRMYAALAPVVLITSAVVFSHLWTANRAMAWAFVVLLVARFFVGNPTVFGSSLGLIQQTGSLSPMRQANAISFAPLLAFYLIGLVYACLVYLVLRSRIACAWREIIAARNARRQVKQAEGN